MHLPNVLITGANGFLGGTIAALLAKQGTPQHWSVDARDCRELCDGEMMALEKGITSYAQWLKLESGVTQYANRLLADAG